MNAQILSGESWHAHEFDVPTYLERVEVEAAAPSLALLERLLEAHVRRFPFGNVDVLLGAHPGVAPGAVQRQIVTLGRGGYCFEHAQLFAGIAEDLGFEVRRRLGRVHSPHAPRTHMTLEVRTEGEWFLADPGFGFSMRGPIALRDGAVRREGGRMFELAACEGGWSLNRDGVLQHIIESARVQPIDVQVGHLVTSLGLASDRFVGNLIAARHMPEGHVTVTQGTRTVRSDGAATVHERITRAEAVEAVRELGVVLSDEEAARLLRVIEPFGDIPS